MRRFFKFKYPKLLGLVLTFAAAYLLVTDAAFAPLQEWIISLGYAGTFLAGVMFSYGFTAAPATAIFLLIGKTQGIYLAAFIGGFGALIGDFLIFKMLRVSFSDELRMLSSGSLFRGISNGVPQKARDYIMPVLAGFIIASPLPDEIGVTLLASTARISDRAFTAISFALNTLGIFAILYIGGAA